MTASDGRPGAGGGERIDQSSNDNEWSWEDVERLISDLKSDGYEPSNLETSTSHAAPEKTIFLDVERTVNSDTDRSDRGVEPVAALPVLVAIASLCILVGLFAAVLGGLL